MRAAIRVLTNMVCLRWVLGRRGPIPAACDATIAHDGKIEREVAHAGKIIGGCGTRIVRPVRHSFGSWDGQSLSPRRRGRSASPPAAGKNGGDATLCPPYPRFARAARM